MIDLEKKSQSFLVIFVDRIVHSRKLKALEKMLACSYDFEPLHVSATIPAIGKTMHDGHHNKGDTCALNQ